MTSTQKNILLI